jgi:hypothetical protein
MSDEPLYCVACGREDCDCAYDVEGPYCHACGVIPTPGMECRFYKEGGRSEPCREDER